MQVIITDAIERGATMLSKERLIKFDLEQDLFYPDNYQYFLGLMDRLTKVVGTHQFIVELPAQPQVSEAIYREELVRAVGGTQIIEGLNMTLEEIQEVLEREDSDIHSQHVQEQEIKQSKEVYEFIIQYVRENPDGPIEEGLIRQIHTIFTRGLPYQYNTPGEYRAVPVRFGTPQLESILQTESEVKEAMARFVEWLNADNLQSLNAFPLVKANLAHYYFTEIHPFGDGNGRTARALEALILFKNGGFNRYCFWSLANYFALHRDEYLKQLRSVRNTQSVFRYLTFSAEGYLTELKRIKARALGKVKKLMLMDYTRDLYRRKKTRPKINKRILALLELFCTEGRKSVEDYYTSPYVIGLYAKLSSDTVRRDLITMRKYELIKYITDDNNVYIEPNYEILESLKYRG
jgi:cell filamentation protein, protein adenylyltransferase